MLVRLGCRLPAGVADALLRPGPLRPGPRLQAGLGLGVLLVVGAGVPARPPPARPGSPRTRRRSGRTCCCGQVQLQHPVDRTGQEPAVVADQHRRRARRPATNVLQPRQAGQVQVVGRLVQQQHVVAVTAAARPARPGPPGRRRAPVTGRSSSTVEAQLGGDRLGPLVQVGGAEAEPALQRRRVRVVGAAARPAPAPRWPRPASRCAAATPVRRARKSRTVSPGPARSGSCGR